MKCWMMTLAALFALTSSTAYGQVTTKRLSVNAGGVQGNGASDVPSMSADGRYVLFSSNASNLVPGDTNGADDAFLVDRQLGTIERVSLAPGGGQIPGYTFAPRLSSDGRHAAYTIVADLGQGTLVGILAHDLDTGVVEIVNLGTQGEYPNSSSSNVPVVTPGGRYVAFESSASNLVDGDTNGRTDIFVRDRLLGVTELVSVSSSGQQGNDRSLEPSISDDGRYVAFESEASNLVPNDTNGADDLFVHDRLTGQTTRISVTDTGAQSNDDSEDARISGDGRYVAFASWGDLTPGLRSPMNVYLYTRATGVIELISASAAGDPADSNCVFPSITRDGRYVGFSGWATNIVPNDTNGTIDAFVRDRVAGTVERISVSSAGQEGNNISHWAVVSQDGKHAAFYSFGSNLVPGDSNAATDVFLRGEDFGDGPSTYCVAKQNSAGCLPAIGWTGSPTLTGPDDFVTTAVNLINNKVGLFFWGQAPTSVPLFGGTLCITSQVQRGQPMGSGGSPSGNDCTGFFQNAFTQSLMASKGYSAGTTLFGQFWYRDPGFASPNDVGLTDALEFTILD